MNNIANDVADLVPQCDSVAPQDVAQPELDEVCRQEVCARCPVKFRDLSQDYIFQSTVARK